MVAYSFKKRFVTPIRYGLGLIMQDDAGNWIPCEFVLDPGATVPHRFDPYTDLEPEALPKRQTIRAIGKRRHARVGDKLQLYTAMRTKQCELIGEARCTRVREITIHVGKRTLLIGIGDMKDALGGDALHEFCRRDGFSGVVDMCEFWNKEHGPGRFSGVLIEWEPRDG